MGGISGPRSSRVLLFGECAAKAILWTASSCIEVLRKEFETVLAEAPVSIVRLVINMDDIRGTTAACCPIAGPSALAPDPADRPAVRPHQPADLHALYPPRRPPGLSFVRDRFVRRSRSRRHPPPSPPFPRHRCKMPWPWQSSKGSKDSISWNESLNVQDWDHYKDPRTWIPAFAVTTVFFCGLKFYRTYLRRIPTVEYIPPDSYRKRRLFGKVTSVGDGDGFHLYHTPGGKWAGWGWLRKIPTDRKALKGNTVSY